jgi:hypothetical protein
MSKSEECRAMALECEERARTASRYERGFNQKNQPSNGEPSRSDGNDWTQSKLSQASRIRVANSTVDFPS